ncbi:hypothetical protein [Pseudanabaena mucicola]|uniref:Uncharacterized protein n=1 Tax=Pseudanabaena mucicola FACHB-723 TaxID=2692860 RepID=A0ABR7ZTC4_9CYAN|nr:hypothetical protein [Pseudanabaena mucicola]MBD2187234.1 hypothetical protein [Pseudanabaena mucicola FACHB-723]
MPKFGLKQGDHNAIDGLVILTIFSKTKRLGKKLQRFTGVSGFTFALLRSQVYILSEYSFFRYPSGAKFN